METFALYLTARVQTHFGIPPSDLQPDTQFEFPNAWHRLWRVDHLLSSHDGSQHAFIFTNAATLKSYIIPVLDAEPMEKLISLFYARWYDSALSFGSLLAPSLKTITRYLRGRPNPLIGSMNQLVYHSCIWLDERSASIKETEAHLQEMPMKIGGKYEIPQLEFSRRFAQEPPYPKGPPGDNFLAFQN